MKYSKELKDSIIRRMLPPNNEAISKISKEEGISEQTIRNWRDNARANGIAAPGNTLLSEKWSTPDKFLIVVETASMNEGEYIAWESTFYRVLRENDMQHHRVRTEEPTYRPISTHEATAPNQVWMWDITYLNGPVKGMFYYLYLISDLFSRDIVSNLENSKLKRS
jgi:transposase-like protein